MTGAGRDLPLALICGVGSDEDIWRAQCRALGGTAFVPRGVSIAAMAHDLLARLPDRFSLAGHSMGGYVALAMQRIAPERIARIALVNSCAEPDDEPRRKGREALIAAIDKRGTDTLAEAMARGVTANPDLRARVAAMFRRAGDVRLKREQRACAARPDARAGLAAIAVPALVIAARDDSLMPAGAAQAMADAIPICRLALFADGGHVTPMAHPGETTRLLREWQDGFAG